MSTSMLADFASRLAFGLAVATLAVPWKAVPPPFFRTQCLIMLGLFVLAGLDESRLAGDRLTLSVLIVVAVLSYCASIAWGIGLPRVAIPLTGLIALLSGGFLALPRHTSAWEVLVVSLSSWLASALLLGATLTAMLLGHHYLTAPAMSITPLRRVVKLMAWALGSRAILAALALGLSYFGSAHPFSSQYASTLFLAMRWGMGIAGTALATTLAWKTVKIRSTQSATGILYIAMTLVLFGELTSLVLSRDSGILM